MQSRKAGKVRTLVALPKDVSDSEGYWDIMWCKSNAPDQYKCAIDEMVDMIDPKSVVREAVWFESHLEYQFVLCV